MNWDDLLLQIQHLQQLLAPMQRQPAQHHTPTLQQTNAPDVAIASSAGAAGLTSTLIQQQQLATMATALSAIGSGLKELQVANEKLHNQLREELSTTQQALVAQRQRYQELFEEVPDGYLLTDKNGAIQEANRAAVTLLNASQTVLVGEALAMYIAEEQRPAVASKLTQLELVDGVQETWEVSLRPPNYRTPITVAVTVKPVRQEDSTLIGWRWILRDITECQRALNSEALLRSVVENSPIIVYALDKEGVITLSEGKGLEAVGRKPGQTVGKSVFDLSHSHPDRLENIRRVLAGTDTTWIWPLGNLVYETRATPVRDENNQVTGLIAVVTDITERQCAQAALQQAKDQLRAVLDAVPGFVSWISSDGRYLGVNQQLADSFNLSPETFVGQELGFCQSREGKFAQLIQNFVASPLDATSQVIDTQVNGRTQSYLITAQKYQQGRAAVSVGIDITERQAARLALQKLNEELENRVRQRTAELEQKNQQLEVEIAQRQQAQETLKRYQLLAEHTRDIILFIQPDGQIIEANQAAVEAYGYERTQLLGLNFQALQVSTTTKALPEQMADAVNQSRLFETIARHKNGSTFPVEVSWQSEVIDQSRVFLSIIRDISKRKRAEEAFYQSEAKFRNFVENANDIIYSLTTEGMFSYVSPNWIDILGHDLKEIEGNAFISFIHPDDLSVCLNFFQKVVTTGAKHSGLEYRIKHKDGSWRWHTTSGSVSKDTQGKILAFIGICRDITAAKQAEAEVRMALEKEKELSELKSSFISMTSHEFRTPLSIILSSADLVELYGHKWTEEKKLTHLHRIQAATQRMTQLLDDVLLLGKAEARKLELKLAPLNLDKFCSDLIEELQLGAGSNYVINLVKRGQCTKTYMDEKLLRHIFTNLLSNAIKYSPEGSTVNFEVLCENGQAVFQIKDRGIGIPEEDQKRLFESFHRANNVGTIPGTGLGLAIVKNSVELHGGKIIVDSEIGVGTVFTVILPLND